MRKNFNMDFGWKFHLGDIEENRKNNHSDSYHAAKAGKTFTAARQNLDDSSWRDVNLPHDYLAEAEIGEDNLLSHGFRTRSNAWYRKSFTLSENLKDKHIFLCFEGTAVTADFYLNGSIVAKTASAYTETGIDITDRVYFGDKVNVLAVYIGGFATEGWWYEGSGIYRHVRLYAKDMLHIAHNGLWINPILDTDTENDWIVEAEATIENSSYENREYSVRFSLYDGDVKIAEKESDSCVCFADDKTETSVSMSVENPKRWDVDSPNLYKVVCELICDGEVIDSDSTRIGFRTFSIDNKKGFFLNGRSLKIKGTCNHQDHAGVGVAVPDSIQYYRIRRLKELGTNAYRCEHNVPAKEILDACDEIGIIVMDVNRRFETRPEVLSHLETMVRRDRNHPSIIFYSLFNEEPLQNTDEGKKIFKRLKSTVQKLDKTRIITGAMNGNFVGAGEEMDIVGINYSISNIEQFRVGREHRCVFGSENNSAVSTRGCYKTDREAHVLDNYGMEMPPWGQSIFETWDFVRSHDYFSGLFIWTGFDYRGEPTPFAWPSVSSQFGIMDTCGFPKDSFYFNRACFVSEPVLHILPHWNHNDGENVRVMTATNCDEVELFLNGKTLGRKPSDVCVPAEWNVTFEKGTLSAIGYRDGKEVARAEQTTTKTPKSIKLEADRPYIINDGQDTVPVKVCVLDEDGREVPTANDHITFECVDGMVLRGVGNGDPNSHESDVASERNLFAGLCQALVCTEVGAKKASLVAKGEGLKEFMLEFEIREPSVTVNYIYNTVNVNLDSYFTASEVATEKPDPIIDIADNDMNSFAPHFISSDDYENFGVEGGYRVYRVLATAPKQTTEKFVAKLDIAGVNADIVEIYVNKKQIYADRAECRGVSVEFPVSPSERLDIRILAKTRENMSNWSGIKGPVKLLF